MGKTKIEYADRVSNPLQVVDLKTGKKGTHCEKPDPDGTCKNCWAETLNTRGNAENQRFGTGLTYDKENRDRVEWIKNEKEMRRLENLNRQKPSSEKFPGNPLIVFTNDTYDLFQPSITDELQDWVFDSYDTFTNLTLLVQTTYVSRMRAYLTKRYPEGMPPQYFIGMSAGTQVFYDANIGHLKMCPAQRRYVIFEPLLQSIFTSQISLSASMNHWEKAIHLFIIGGESGPTARRCFVGWIRNLVGRAKTLKIAVLVKQMGSNCQDRNDAGFDGDDEEGSWPENTQTYDDGDYSSYQGDPVRVRLKNRKGGDPSEWPEDLRIREFPALAVTGGGQQ